MVKDIAALILIVLILSMCSEKGLQVCYSNDSMWECKVIKLRRR